MFFDSEATERIEVLWKKSSYFFHKSLWIYLIKFEMIYTQHLKYLFYIHFIKIRKKCYYFYYDVLIDVFFKITKSCLLMQIVHSSASLYHQKCWILSIYLRGFFDQSASILDHIPFLTLSWLQQHEYLIRIVYLVITIFSHKKSQNKNTLKWQWKTFTPDRFCEEF